MFAKIRLLLKNIAVYMQDNPGAVGIIASGVVLFAAHFGLHVTVAEFEAIAAALIPILAGGHLLARRARARRGSDAAVASPEAPPAA